MDEMLRSGIPEIKLALGEVIDRENARPLPPRYARLLPPSVLTVILRDDAGEALRPVAHGLERELTDSCNRHGSLYDRRYRVELQRTEDPDAPLYSVAVHAGRNAEAGAPEPGAGVGSGIAGTSDGGPVGEPAGRPAEDAAAAPIPTTVVPDVSLPDGRPPAGWEDGRWVLVVEDSDGAEREVFRIAEPTLTVGRSAADPGIRPSIAISDAPHVSRRQLALAWEARGGSPGFRVYNLGLNAVHVLEEDIPGARVGRAGVDLESVSDKHIGWLPPGVPLRIGDHGPTLRIDEVPPGPDDFPVDPDATVFD